MSESNYNFIQPETGVPIKAWTKGVAIEAEAEKQLRNVARLPFIYKWVRRCRMCIGGSAQRWGA